MTTDVIVLGAGGAGSAAAYYLARRGQRVLLLEQFAIDHPYGSSFGNSRIIRYMYDHATYVGMAKAAYPLWYALQDEAGERLLYETGGLDFGRRGAPTLEATLNAVKQFGIAVEQLTPAEGMRRYPQFRFDDDMTILYQRDYGLLNASACVKAHVRLAARHGVVVVENAPVIRIDVRDGGVEVVTPQGTHAAERLIVTAGAWTAPLLAPLGVNLPLQVERVQYVFLQAPNPDDYRPGRYPIFISHLYESYEHVPYSIPDYDGAGVKLAFHGGEAVASADEVNRAPDTDAVDKLRPFLRDVLPDLADAPARETHVCLYSMTPDHHFVIDQHPVHANILFASPCSGHGFKFTTLIGSMLADWSIDGKTEHDLSLFTHTRFAAHESIT